MSEDQIMGFDVVWHGPEPNAEWRHRAQKEIKELLGDGLDKPSDLMFHDVWDDHPDERPRIFIYGEKDDDRFHVDYLT